MNVRTLFVVKELPHPPMGGDDLRVWQNVRAACSAGPVAVFAVQRRPAVPAPDPRIESWTTAQDPGLVVDTRGTSALDWLRDPQTSPADSYISELSADELARLMDEFQPDVAVLESIFLHRYLPGLAPCPIVVDCHNVEVVVHADLARVADGAHKLIRRRFTERVSRFEREAVEAAARVWVCSEDERALMERSYGPAAPVTVLPNGVDVESYPHSRGKALELVFPASFAWLPNERAARVLVEKVMPALPPQAHLTLCGTRVPAWLREVADRRVEITGTVPDTRPYLARAGCMPIPLHEGGGTRLKAVEAFASRLPVVSTAKGIEGIGVEAGRHYLAAETGAEFVDAIQALDRDPDLGGRLAESAAAFVRERCSWEVAERIVGEDLRSIMRPIATGP